MTQIISCIDYIKLSDSAVEKINRIDEIIEKFEDALLSDDFEPGLQQYRLDTGQTVVSATFQDTSSISRAIEKLEARKYRIINRQVGYRYGLKDGKTILPC